MHLLVTGGAGFIGSHFIRYWLAEHPEDTIVNVDLLTYAGNLENLRSVEHHPHYRFLHADICDLDAMRKAMVDIDWVVHFAAESHNDRAIADPSIFVRTNVLGTDTLLQAAREACVKRFHHISTCEVFGELELDEKRSFQETDAMRPKTPYNASKAAANHLVMAAYHTFKLPVTISHCANNYGPYQHPEKMIPVFTINAILGKPLPLFQSSTYMREWIHVDDHIRAIDAILRCGRIGESYNIGTREERSIEEIADAVLDLTGRPRTLKTTIPDRLQHDKRYVLNPAKINAELGWQPRILFVEGLRDTVRWYVEHRTWWEPLFVKSSSSIAIVPIPHTHPMKTLIFGKGWIGTRMAHAWPNAVLSDARIDDRNAVQRALEEHHPDAVINAAGKTGSPNVDWCETHQNETMQANVVGALTLAEVCQEYGVYLVHLGSGCIFYGPSPDPTGWREEDYANPSAFYSRSKYAADLLLSRLPNTAVIRLRMPIDHMPSPRNLITKLATYTRVIDVENSVTVVEDLLDALKQIIEKQGTGIFHVVNPGTMRHRDLLALYKEYVDPSHSCAWIHNDDLVRQGLATKGRSNCVLQSKRLTELGIHLRPIDVALRETIQHYAATLRIQRMSSQQITTPPPPRAIVASTPTSIQSMHQPRQMKGVIAAGGVGTRLAPLTNLTNKHLLPIYNKPMILFPLQTLLQAGIKDIMLITGSEHAHLFMKLLGSGKDLGCSITYRIQDQAEGIAQVVGMAETFVGNDNVTVILGDNIFETSFHDHVVAFTHGATTFYCPVANPQRFGVIELDSNSTNVISIEEKPKQPKSNLAQVGLYIYDAQVFSIIRNLKPSARGELEISDVNAEYLARKQLTAFPVQGFWTDAGTFTSLKRAADFFASRDLMHQ